MTEDPKDPAARLVGEAFARLSERIGVLTQQQQLLAQQVNVLTAAVDELIARMNELTAVITGPPENPPSASAEGARN